MGEDLNGKNKATKRAMKHDARTRIEQSHREWLWGSIVISIEEKAVGA